MHTDPAYIFLWRALAIFLLLGALFGVLLGVMLIVKPQYLERLNRVANRWVSTRRLSRWADSSFNIERWFYRHHRVTGAIIVLVATYNFFFFGVLFDKAYTLQRLGLKWMIPAKLLEGLLEALVLVSLIGGAVAMILGLIILLRPSLLRGMEEEANLWVSTRRATKIFDVPHDQIDRYVARHAQRVGWLLLLGSIYLFFALFRSLA